MSNNVLLVFVAEFVYHRYSYIGQLIVYNTIDFVGTFKQSIVEAYHNKGAHTCKLGCI